ncbi:MAG: nitronate monooxygenase [Candidatus Omnitrophota bacterium]|nr:MAG: nitronate monooxygenase [Candidatus Omnitrophota bacterium]
MKLPELVIGDLKIDIPIIQGGMGVRVSTASLASAVSNEGALGVIASVGLGEESKEDMTYEERSKIAFREMIRETKRLTNRKFGVNIMYALTNYDDLVNIAVEEEVGAIITGAGLPLHLPALVKNSMPKLIPIVSSARAAEIILRTWFKRYQKLPDAFIVEGPLAGGHLGFSYSEAMGIEQIFLEDIVGEVVNLVKEYKRSQNKEIPVIAAGGIFTGADIAQMLKLGASGVQMATRFVCTSECDVSEKYKEAYLKCKQEDIVVILSPAGMPARVIKNEFVERIQAGEKMKFECPFKCLKSCDPYSANYCIAQALVNAYRGNLDEGFAMCGANAYRLKEIVSVKELIYELIEQSIKEFYKIKNSISK